MRVNLKSENGNKIHTGRDVELFDANGKRLDLSDVLCVEIKPLSPDEMATVTVTYALDGLGNGEQ